MFNWIRSYTNLNKIRHWFISNYIDCVTHESILIESKNAGWKLTCKNHKIDIEHPYALSKYLGERAVIHWNKVYKLPTNSIRIFNAYGPRVRTTGAYGAVIGVFLKQKIKNKPLTIVGNGKQSRDFVYVTDVCKAFYAAAKTKHTNEVYNVGTSNPQTVNTLAKLVGGKKVFIPDRPGEPRVSKADIRKIKKQLICAFMALFMLHRFYLGRYLSGTIQILTGGGFIIWWIMDAVDIYKCKMKDSNGNKLIEHFFLP